jgi:hypothetical protein
VINTTLNPVKNYTSNLPWIDFKFDRITIINEGKNIRSCHAILVLNDKTNTTKPPRVEFFYKVYLADNKEDVHLTVDEITQKNLVNYISAYAINAMKIIEDYTVTADGRGLYVLTKPDDCIDEDKCYHDLMLNQTKITSDSYLYLEIDKKNFKINGNDTYIISYGNGGNFFSSGIFIVQIQKWQNSLMISNMVPADADDVRQDGNTLIIPSGKYLNYIYKNGKILSQHVRMPDKIFTDEEIMSGHIYFQDLFGNSSKFRSKFNFGLKQINAPEMPWISYGVQSPLGLINFGTYKMFSGCICEPHNCGSNAVIILYSQESSRLIGLYESDSSDKSRSGNKKIVFGDKPTQVELDFLESIANQ